MTDLRTSIHAPHASELTKIENAYDSDAELVKRSSRLKDCASHGRIYIDPDTQEGNLWIHRCGDRLCPLCAKYRANQVSAQLSVIIKKIPELRHIVLTLRNYPPGELRDAVRSLRESFARLRRNPVWKEKVTGGAYVVEITRNPKTLEWHPHLHILADGDYFSQKLLSAMWAEASRGSTVVWISRAQEKHANYLAKYAAKPPDIERWPLDAICEYAKATRGLRMVQTFGSFHGMDLKDRDNRPEPSKTKQAVSLWKLRAEAKKGHPAAVALATAVCDRYPSLWLYFRTLVEIPCPTVQGRRKIPISAAKKNLDHTSKYCLLLCDVI